MQSLLDFDRWRTLALCDPVERQLAPLLQFLLAGLVGVVLVTAPIFLVVLGVVTGGAIVSGQAVTAVFALWALIVLQRGQFQRAVILSSVGLLLALGLVMPLLGVRTGAPFLIVFMFPIALAALLAGRRIAGAVVALSVGIVGVVALSDYLALPFAGRLALPENLSIPIVATFVGAVSVLGFFLARFGTSLRAALSASTLREQELARLSASLEGAVAERTTALQTALQTVQRARRIWRKR
jgi:hypothetical protein